MVARADEYKAEAEKVVAAMRDQLGVELNYDKESVAWLEGYIDRIRPQLTNESYSGLATALGAYLGESIIATYGGSWDYFEEQDSGEFG